MLAFQNLKKVIIEYCYRILLFFVFYHGLILPLQVITADKIVKPLIKKKITLTEKYAGQIMISNLEIGGVDKATSDPEFYINMESIDGEGNNIGYRRQIVDKDQVMSTSVGDIKKSINHISNQLAFIGAQTRKTDQQLNFLGERLTIVTAEVSELGDADLTKLVTDLQATIVNRDAAQAAFVKIGQQSLFDFLR